MFSDSILEVHYIRGNLTRTPKKIIQIIFFWSLNLGGKLRKFVNVNLISYFMVILLWSVY